MIDGYLRPRVTRLVLRRASRVKVTHESSLGVVVCRFRQFDNVDTASDGDGVDESSSDDGARLIETAGDDFALHEVGQVHENGVRVLESVRSGRGPTDRVDDDGT